MYRWDERIPSNYPKFMRDLFQILKYQGFESLYPEYIHSVYYGMENKLVRKGIVKSVRTICCSENYENSTILEPAWQEKRIVRAFGEYSQSLYDSNLVDVRYFKLEQEINNTINEQ